MHLFLVSALGRVDSKVSGLALNLLEGRVGAVREKLFFDLADFVVSEEDFPFSAIEVVAGCKGVVLLRLSGSVLCDGTLRFEACAEVDFQGASSA